MGFNQLLKGLFLLFILGNHLFAQPIHQPKNTVDNKNQKQGRWVVGINDKSAITKTKDSISYYRYIKYKDNKQVGFVKDYYKTGKIYRKGNLASQDVLSTFIPNENFQVYNDKGKKDWLLTLSQLLHLQLKSKQTEKAIETANLIVKEKLNRKDSLTETFISTAQKLATTFYQYKLIKEGDYYLEKTDSAITKLYGTESLTYAIFLEKRSQWKGYNQEFDKAIEYLKVAITLYKKYNGELDHSFLKAKYNLSIFYEKTGDYKKAKELELSLLNPFYIKKDFNSYLLSIAHIGYLFNVDGDTRKADSLNTAGYNCLKTNKDIKLETQLVFYDGYSTHLLRLGLLDKAIANLEIALENKIKLYGLDNINTANTRGNLSIAYRRKGNYTAAEKLSLLNLKIYKRELGENSNAYLTSLQTMADHYHYTKEYRKSMQLYNEVLRSKQKNNLTKDHNYALLLGNVASVSIKMNNYKVADSLSYAAIKTYNLLEQKNEAYTNLLRRLTFSLYNQGKTEAARNILSTLNIETQKKIESIFSSLSEEEKDKFFEITTVNFFNWFTYFSVIDNSPELIGQLYNNQLNNKALLLNSTLKWKTRILNGTDEELKKLFKLWEKNQLKMTSLYQSGKKSDLKKIDSLKNLNDFYEKEFSKKSEALSQISAKQNITWQDVQKKLKANEVAVEIVRLNKYGIQRVDYDSSDFNKPYQVFGKTDTVYYALLLINQKSNYPSLHIIKNGNDLEERYFRYYKNAIRLKTIDTLSFHQFWKPLETLINNNNNSSKVTTVYLSPDGVFNEINLNTLFNNKNSRYLIQDYNILQVTNTKELVSTTKPIQKQNNSFLVGYPDYLIDDKLVAKTTNQETVTEVNRNSWLVELPATKIEVQKISNYFKEKTLPYSVITGKEANESAIKKLVNPKVLHIATHGFFQPNEDSHTMLSSGLVLAGAADFRLQEFKNQTDEDGILTSLEAMNMNLDETDLVVLSACETGLGKNRSGEGLYGLQRAFKIAGAKTIINSLWKVNDQATEKLMSNFYKYWLGGLSKRDAFKKAQLELMKEYRQPYYWGAFVIVGQ